MFKNHLNSRINLKGPNPDWQLSSGIRKRAWSCLPPLSIKSRLLLASQIGPLGIFSALADFAHKVISSVSMLGTLPMSWSIKTCCIKRSVAWLVADCLVFVLCLSLLGSARLARWRSINVSWGGVVHVQKEKNEARHLTPALSLVCAADLCRSSGIRKIVWSEVLLLCVNDTKMCYIKDKFTSGQLVLGLFEEGVGNSLNSSTWPFGRIAVVGKSQSSSLVFWLLKLTAHDHGNGCSLFLVFLSPQCVLISQKNTQHKTSPLTRTSKNQHGHKNASFL